MLWFAARRWLVTTLTHTLVIYEPYSTDPLLPRQPLFKHTGPQQCHSLCVIAPICAESTCINKMCQAFISHHLSQAATCCTEKRKKAHKDKNHISLEGACVTVIYAVSILAPHWEESEFWVGKSICAEAVGASIGFVIWSLLSIFRGQRERNDKGRRTWPLFLLFLAW